MLRVKLLNSSAKAPTVAHPGEDLGYDIYAAFMIIIAPRSHAVVPTGIAIECTSPTGEAMGALLRDKSSMAARRLVLTGGVIDAGYRGEIKVLMENLSDSPQAINARRQDRQPDSLPCSDRRCASCGRTGGVEKESGRVWVEREVSFFLKSRNRALCGEGALMLSGM